MTTSSDASPPPQKLNFSGVIGLHDQESIEDKASTRAKSPLRTNRAEFDIQHQPGNDDTQGISFETESGALTKIASEEVTRLASLLQAKDASLQKALNELTKTKQEKENMWGAMATTRKTAHDAENQVRLLKEQLFNTKGSLQDTQSQLEETKDELAKAEQLLDIQKGQCEQELEKISNLGTNIWIRMSRLEVRLAETYGELFIEEEDQALKECATETLNIPLSFQDVLGDLEEQLESEDLVNGETRIIDEVEDEEAAMIENHALVVWRKPLCFFGGLLNNSTILESLGDNSSDQKQPFNSLVQVAPMDGCSVSSRDGGSVNTEEKSSRSSDEPEKERSQVKCLKEGLSPSLTDNHFEPNIIETANEVSTQHQSESASTAAENIDQALSPSTVPSSERGNHRGTADCTSSAPTFGAQSEAPSPPASLNVDQAPSSVDGLFADADQDFKAGMKSEKPKLTKAQRKAAAMKRDAEVAEKSKAAEEARRADEKKRRKMKKGLKK